MQETYEDQGFVSRHLRLFTIAMILALVALAFWQIGILNAFQGEDVTFRTAKFERHVSPNAKIIREDTMPVDLLAGYSSWDRYVAKNEEDFKRLVIMAPPSAEFYVAPFISSQGGKSYLEHWILMPETNKSVLYKQNLSRFNCPQWKTCRTTWVEWRYTQRELVGRVEIRPLWAD